MHCLTSGDAGGTTRDMYGKAPRDSNTYSTTGGAIIVGKVAAAAARDSTCFGGQYLPFGDQRDIYLGDVIISEGLVQCDLGKQPPT